MNTRVRATSKKHPSRSPSDIRALKKELTAEKARRIAAETLIDRMASRLDRVEEELSAFRNSKSETEEFLQEKIRKLEKALTERDIRIEEYERQLTWLKKQLFDSTSEKGIPTDGKKNKTSDDPANDGKTKRPRGQQRGSKGHSRSDKSALQDDKEVLEISDCTCPDCGLEYRKLDQYKKSQLAEFSINLYLVTYLRSIYVSKCKCAGSKIVTAPPPPKLYPKTNIGNTLWHFLLTEKFLSLIPTSRTLKMLSLKGLPLSAGTVTGGFKKIENMLDNLYNRILDHCRGASFWHADETGWRVFDSDRRRWWLWAISSNDAVVYILDKSRSSKVPADFFTASSGTLMTDRYSAYKALHAGIQKVWCWVHQRRDFLNIYNGNPKLRKWAKAWLLKITDLFILENTRFRLWQSGQTSGSQWKQVNDALLAKVQELEQNWRQQLKGKNLHKSQRTVLTSLKNHWPGLTMFLEDPRIPLHNNWAERLLRGAAVLRKNSYGSGTEWAGNLAAKMFSISQTWVLNGLNPDKLLQAFLDECSLTSGKAPANLDAYLPWKMSAEQKDEFALPESFKRPA